MGSPNFQTTGYASGRDVFGERHGKGRAGRLAAIADVSKNARVSAQSHQYPASR